MANKNRLAQLEKQQKTNTVSKANSNPANLQIRIVNYRAGLSPGIKEPSDAIPVRWVDMVNIANKDGVP